MPSRLLLATNNAGKLAEYDVLLEGCGWEVVTPRDLGIDIEVEETGETYEANATIKARRGSEASGLVTLADDSGIEIEAMGGDPGVHSARFLGENASYAERFAEIQRRLAGVPRERRRARFRCVIAVADPVKEVSDTTRSSGCRSTPRLWQSCRTIKRTSSATAPGPSRARGRY